MRPRTWVCYRHWTQSVQTHLLLLRLMTLSLCISPISSGSDSSLLECRKSTDACFQFPIWDERRARSQTLETNSSHCLSTLEQTDRQVGNDVHTDLWRKLSKEVVISSKRAHGNAQAHRGRQGFNLIETAVQLFQICQANRANNNRGKMEKKEKHILSEFPQIFCEIQLWLIYSECENSKTGLPWFKLVVADNNVILNITYWSASSKTIWMTLLRLGNIIKFK